jgi:TRAP-type C4-dicarboxylate transport system permease small subunit
MTRSFAKRCLAALEWTLDATGAAFGIVIGALILLMAVEIAIRFYGIGSLSWLIEIAEYTLCGGTFLAAPWVLRQGAHVRIDILVTALPRRLGKRLEQFCDLLGCGISALLSYYGCVMVLRAWNANAILFKSWWTPEWIVLLPVPVACLLLFAEFVLRFFRVEGVVSDTADPTKRASI